MKISIATRRISLAVVFSLLLFPQFSLVRSTHTTRKSERFDSTKYKGLTQFIKKTIRSKEGVKHTLINKTIDSELLHLMPLVCRDINDICKKLADNISDLNHLENYSKLLELSLGVLQQAQNKAKENKDSKESQLLYDSIDQFLFGLEEGFGDMITLVTKGVYPPSTPPQGLPGRIDDVGCALQDHHVSIESKLDNLTCDLSELISIESKLDEWIGPNTNETLSYVDDILYNQTEIVIPELISIESKLDEWIGPLVVEINSKISELDLSCCSIVEVINDNVGQRTDLLPTVTPITDDQINTSTLSVIQWLKLIYKGTVVQNP